MSAWSHSHSPIPAIPEDAIPEQDPPEDNPDERINRKYPQGLYSENVTDRQTHSLTHTHTEHQQDKRISRDDEYSDSEDEGDGRRNEHTYRDIKRPRLLEEQRSKPSILPKSVTGGQAISSPVPPEPSPITPVAQDEGGPPTNKGTCSTTLVECGIHISIGVKCGIHIYISMGVK